MSTQKDTHEMKRPSLSYRFFFIPLMVASIVVLRAQAASTFSSPEYLCYENIVTLSYTFDVGQMLAQAGTLPANITVTNCSFLQVTVIDFTGIPLGGSAGTYLSFLNVTVVGGSLGGNYTDSYWLHIKGSPAPRTHISVYGGSYTLPTSDVAALVLFSTEGFLIWNSTILISGVRLQQLGALHLLGLGTTSNSSIIIQHCNFTSSTYERSFFVGVSKYHTFNASSSIEIFGNTGNYVGVAGTVTFFGFGAGFSLTSSSSITLRSNNFTASFNTSAADILLRFLYAVGPTIELIGPGGIIVVNNMMKFTATSPTGQCDVIATISSPPFHLHRFG